MMDLFKVFWAVMAGTLLASNVNAATGFLSGEATQGMYKICFYNALGENVAVTVGGADICPTSYEFGSPPLSQSGSIPPRRNSSLNETIARGFGDQIKGLGTAYGDSRNQQRTVDSNLATAEAERQAAEIDNQRRAIGLERERLELEALRRQAAQSAATGTNGMVACIFPDPASRGDFIPLPVVYLSRKDGQLLTLVGGNWRPLPIIYGDGEMELSGPFIARTNSAEGPIFETARLRINGQTEVAELQLSSPLKGCDTPSGLPRFTGKCTAMAAP